MNKKILSMIISSVMLTSLLVGCSSSSNTTSTSTNNASNKSYTFAHNLWGSGAYPLEIIAKEAKTELQYFGCKLDVADNQFTIDKVITDLQGQIAKGVNGVEFFGIAATQFTAVNKLCNDAKMPFVLYDKLPTTDAIFAPIKASKYFVGAVSAEEYAAGEGIAKLALADGAKKAILVRAAVGDMSHDERQKGFTATFKAGGGEVLGVVNCADPSEAVTKSNDIITAYPDADSLYGIGGDFALGALNAIKSRNDKSSNLKVYATDITPDLAQALLDGKIKGLNGGQWVCGAIANTLLINYLDGHPILDPDGKAPVFTNLKMATLTADKAQAFIDLMKADKSPISEQEYKNLTYRYNPNVSYQTYKDFIGNYDKIFMEKLK
ncbi:substrate-binding domain-containing protein [Clostridium sp. SYSU_GA19001]|uniref:sugar ABC transporter substrate-binding protein n=1 Tax=Clostridium caldaquaticum TaxID=2940653 RepID=UPI00207796CB|nr:substrate-binding domain-containing protein [Clostridium caldaquaticum]MCM8709965.1 substrate-binding domain-containing protein [Clostridium caldaquaticum]